MTFFMLPDKPDKKVGWLGFFSKRFFDSKVSRKYAWENDFVV